MQRLITVVTELLSKHTCVIIPEFGGFIINEKSAVVNSAEGHFFPPRKELIFNSHLSHNDGLLAHALMQKRSISFDEANRIIVEEVSATKRVLESRKIYSLGNVGFFSSEATGIIFHAKEIEIEDAGAFGLREFYFPALRTSDETTNVRRLSTNQTGGTSSVSRVIMGGVAATLALFLFCQPLQNEGGTDHASLLPALSFSEAAIRNAELINKEKELQESLETKELDYYLVIGEMESEEEALSFVDTTELQEGDSLRVLPLSEKFLITFGTSSEFEKISDRMKDFHSRYTEFPDAFVLGLQ